MPSHVDWLIPGKVICQVHWDELTIEDVQAMPGAVLALFAATDAPVIHLLVDAKRLNRVPSDALRIREITRPVFAHDKLGAIVAISSANTITRFFIRFVATMAGYDVKFVDEYAGAIKALQAIDPSLDDFPAHPSVPPHLDETVH